MAVITKDREPIPGVALPGPGAARRWSNSRRRSGSGFPDPGPLPGQAGSHRDAQPDGADRGAGIACHLRGSQRTSSPALTLASVQTCSHRRYSDNGPDTESSSMVTRLESARRDPELRPGPARPWRVIKSLSRTALLRARRPRSPASPPPHSAQAAWQPARPAPAPRRPPATRPGQLAQHLAARRNPRPSRVPGRSC